MGTTYTTVSVQSLSNFLCRLWMMRGEPLLILGHGVKGQGQLCPLVRGCHALRCLVLFAMGNKRTRVACKSSRFTVFTRNPCPFISNKNNGTQSFKNVLKRQILTKTVKRCAALYLYWIIQCFFIMHIPR